MPKIKKEQKKEYMMLIRQVLVYHPDAGVLAVQKILAEPMKSRPNGLKLDYHYLQKLIKEIRKERTERVNQGVLNRISELQDHYKILAGEVKSILSRVDVDSKVKVDYLLKLFEKNVILFRAEMDAGIFERQLGTVLHKHNIEITDEQRYIILKALSNFGIIKKEGYDKPTGQPMLADGRKNGGAVNQQS
jgi:hypothetical protein